MLMASDNAVSAPASAAKRARDPSNAARLAPITKTSSAICGA